MPSFKTDESFLEKISIGVIGTRRVFDLIKELGHDPIELERGSMNYKIWKKIKIKRIRVPDILCVDNGIRVESRAKTKLEITMSHSVSDPDRGWDYGMKNTDYVALVVCKKEGARPIDWKADQLVQFFSIGDLRDAEAQGLTVLVKAKGAQEGFEARITWPSKLASADGVVTEVTETAIKYKNGSGRKNSVSLTRHGKNLAPLVHVGENVVQHQIIATVIPVYKDLPKVQVTAEHFLQDLLSLDLSDRYAAAKALSKFNSPQVVTALKEKIFQDDEHIYVRLEAAASLARFGENDGYGFIEATLLAPYLQNVLEAVIVLAEIKSERSCNLLCKVLEDENQDSEIRAGAAWGLGEQQNQSALNAIVKSFNSVNENIKVEAARALGKLTQNFSYQILDKFNESNVEEMPGIAWALTKSQSISLGKLLESLKDLESRQWVSFIIGMQGEEKYVSEIEKLKAKDPEVYFAVTLLWKIITSWIYDLKEY